MKVLSYNIYGKKDVVNSIPSWEIRQKSLEKNIRNILLNHEIKVLCFQEVNQNNEALIQKICDENMNYLGVKDGFYQLFTEKELKIMNDLVWYFYNYYSLYLDKLSNGKEKLPYDYRNNTKIYVLS